MSQWNPVCPLTQILPATGVCALVKGQQIAIFRPRNDEQGNPERILMFSNNAA